MRYSSSEHGGCSPQCTYQQKPANRVFIATAKSRWSNKPEPLVDGRVYIHELSYKLE